MNKNYEEIEVNDRKSFAIFLGLLLDDLINDKDSWENPTLESFLEAMTAYVADIQYFYRNTGQNINADIPTWELFADIFKGAKIYE